MFFSLPNLRRLAVSGYEVVRIVTAAVLLVAAGFKAHQLATEPVLGTGVMDSRWFLIGVVEGELFLALWLLADVLPALSWVAALGCLGLFTGVSLYKALSGDATCGCFGRLPVNPWYTTGLDFTLVLALLYGRPPGLQSPTSAFASLRQFKLRALPLRALAGLTAAWVLVGVPVAVAMRSYPDTEFADAGNLAVRGGVVVLQPETWLGQRFPLLDSIDIGESLKRARWVVLLHRHDCPRCHEVMPEYLELARRAAANPALPRVALIEMPPYGGGGKLALPLDAPVAVGRLREDKQWFAQAPLVLEISDSVVVKAKASK